MDIFIVNGYGLCYSFFYYELPYESVIIRSNNKKAFMIALFLFRELETSTAWKVSKYGPEITPYLDTFHPV